jgi:hypothetical protein
MSLVHAVAVHGVPAESMPASATGEASAMPASGVELTEPQLLTALVPNPTSKKRRTT